MSLTSAKMAGALALAVLFGSVARGQSAPAFEAASLKPSGPDSSRGVSVTSTQWVWSRATLHQLIQTAFDVKNYSFPAPAWMDGQEFDMVAKFPSGAPPRERSKMLQTLLVERFKLTFHYEPRTTNGYALVVAKGGMKVQPVEGGEQGGTMGPDRFTLRNTSLAQLANMLSYRLNLPVQDQTGKAGVFDFQMKWTPEAGPPAMAGAPDAAADPNGPSLFNALQEQLGLKLETRKLPVDVLVVDHAEKTPVEN
jgi:uncharacterized protein (TIGR03435 family)